MAESVGSVRSESSVNLTKLKPGLNDAKGAIREASVGTREEACPSRDGPACRTDPWDGRGSVVVHEHGAAIVTIERDDDG
jgi:hypothetical protein